MKKTDMSRKQELFLDGNPLTYPPVDVCECGLKSMMRYFQETQANVKVYQGVKVNELIVYERLAYKTYINGSIVRCCKFYKQVFL